jgi:hypothetical protein
VEGYTPEFRDLSLLLSIVAFVLTTLAVYVARRLNGDATLTLKLGLSALWLYSALRIYSSSSYLWGSTARDANLFDALRLGVVSVMTVLVIITGALLVFYWRRIKEKT